MLCRICVFTAFNDIALASQGASCLAVRGADFELCLPCLHLAGYIRCRQGRRAERGADGIRAANISFDSEIWGWVREEGAEGMGRTPSLNE